MAPVHPQPHQPSITTVGAATASAQPTRRASTGSNTTSNNGRGTFRKSFRDVAQALFKLNPSVRANADADGDGEEDENLDTRKQKIARALKHVLEAIKTVGASNRSGLSEHVRELLETLVAKGELAQEDMMDVMLQTTPIHADLYLESQMSKGQAAIETLLFTYADLATDVLMIVQYYADGRSGVATLMLAVLAFSLVVHALNGHVLGQGKAMTLAGLLGLKPALETLRDLLDAKPFPKQIMPNEFMLIITRVVELVFESSPETLIQAVALLATPTAEQSSLQYLSLLASIAAIGALTTLGDRELDTFPAKRESEPLLFGYVSRDPWNNMVQLATSAIAFSCYSAARMLALGVLIVAALERWAWSTVALLPPLGWVAVECGFFAAARIRDGSWHFYKRQADNAVVRVGIHLVAYVGMATAPFPLFRAAPVLGPHLYARTLACLSASNFALVAVAYGVLSGVDALSAHHAWMALGGLTLVAWTAAAVLVACAPPDMRKTFWEVRTWKMHVKLWWWDEQESDTEIVDGKEVELIGQEAVRAFLPCWVSYHALPLPELKALYEERWAAWEAEPPEWFSPAFQECVYDELVPAHVLNARIEAREAASARSGTLTRIISQGRSKRALRSRREVSSASNPTNSARRSSWARPLEAQQGGSLVALRLGTPFVLKSGKGGSQLPSPLQPMDTETWSRGAGRGDGAEALEEMAITQRR